MAPNGTGTVIVAWLLAVASFVMVVALWPRLAAHNWRAVVGRVGVQAVACILVLVAVAATMNAENGWYANWTDLGNDLVGTAAPHSPPVTYGASAVQPALTPAATRADASASRAYQQRRAQWESRWEHHQHRTGHGQYLRVSLPGPTGRPVSMQVWLPAAYTDPAQADRTFPVIMAFHGVPGTPEDYDRPVHIGRTISRLVAQHKLAPAIVVAPDYTPHALDTECVDAPRLPMLTWLSQDVPRWVVKHLRARPDRASWATVGFSAGGYCAALVAMHRPQQFASTIVLGGYFQPRFERWNPFGDKVPASYDLMQREQTDPPPIAAWVQVALQDPVSGRASERFATHARPPMSATEVVWRRVGHRMSVWIQAMPLALEWLGATRAGFRPDAS